MFDHKCPHPSCKNGMVKIPYNCSTFIGYNPNCERELPDSSSQSLMKNMIDIKMVGTIAERIRLLFSLSDSFSIFIISHKISTKRQCGIDDREVDNEV